MSFKNNSFRFSLLLTLLCLVFFQESFANGIKKCDSLIASGMDAMHKKEHARSLELLTQARALSKGKNWYKQDFYTLNNIAINYSMLLEYGEAMNYYNEAYKIALRKELGPKFEMIVLNNIAILYSKEKNFEKAKEHFKKAYNIAKKNKNSLKIGLYGMNLGNVNNETKNIKAARTYFTESLAFFEKNSNYFVLTKIGLAECDLSEGKTTQAREIAEHLLKTAKDLKFDDIGILLEIIISKSYLKENNLEMASFFTNKVFKRNPNLEQKIILFELLSEISSKQDLCEKALLFKDSIVKTNALMNEIRNGKLYETNKIKFEIQDYKNQIVLNETKLSNERKIFYSIITIIIIVVISIIWILRNLSVKHKQKKLIAERNEQILALELEKEKNESLLLEKQLNEQKTIGLLEQERLKNEVELKNRKLSAKALYLSGRNQMIEDVLSELSEIPQVAKEDSLANHIKILKTHLKTDNEWDSFITHFEEVNQTFLATLKSKHPNLTANDIRFISYIYMNLSTKEIASMFNITPESCRKRKERIATKMEIPENIKLYDYLASL